jgi:16S rRNA (adenine1518-N6/adenine1519-N6)-dimethyltransferase
MDLTSPKTIKEILEEFGAKPSKGLGQNFLIDKNILQKIIDSSDIKEDDIVLEIGPGMGTLTHELAKKAKKVIAIEKDQTMVDILSKTISQFNNVQIISQDILETKIEDLKLENNKYKVIANIPYYLTSPLIRKLLEEKIRPSEIILMIQKEVAQRICAKVGDMNLLAVSVQFYAEPKIISYVKKGCFFPAPKIDSAIIKITPKENPTVNIDLFFKIVKAGFSHPRKQLQNNFNVALNIEKDKILEWLDKNNIKPNQRAETLSVNDWKNLTKSFV